MPTCPRQGFCILHKNKTRGDKGRHMEGISQFPEPQGRTLHGTKTSYNRERRTFEKQQRPFRYKIKYEKNRLVKVKTGLNVGLKSEGYVNMAAALSAQKSNLPVSYQLRQLDEALAFCNTVDLREVTIMDLQKAMATRHITALDLVRCYTARITAMDPYLNAVIELNPDAEQIAKKLDENREVGILHGPLHGIPVLIKDNIATGDKMETTAGSNALLGIKPRDDAEIVKRLRRAGAIILGKTNLSEFAYFRGTAIPNGWSSRGNQTKNAYVLSKDPDGSSTGSAVAVSCNLIPVAIGTETDGSIVDPASRASVVGLKPSIHRIPNDGVIPLSFSQDVIGPIARTVADVAVLFHVISKYGFKDSCFSVKSGLDNCAINNLRVGVLRDPNWERQEVWEQVPQLEDILNILKAAGVYVEDPIEPSPGTLASVTTDSEILVFLHEFKFGINEYLQTKVKQNLRGENGRTYSIASLDDIIEFNRKCPTAAGPYNQDLLIKSSQTDGILNKTYLAEREKNQMAASVYTKFLFDKYSLDAIIVPSLNASQVSAVGGYPIITVPAGFTEDQLPFGVALYGQQNSDEILLQLAHLIERNLHARKPPNFLP